MTLSLSIQLPRYGDAISATSLAISQDTVTTRLGVAVGQGLHIIEERLTTLKREKRAIRGV